MINMKGFICVVVSIFILSSGETAETKEMYEGTEGACITAGNDIYQVILPTDGDLDFVMDPQGLLSIEETGEYDSSWAGEIRSRNGKGALIINQSSFPIKVSVKMYVTGEQEKVPSGIRLLDDESMVDEGTSPQMCLYAILGESKINDLKEFSPSDQKIAITADNAQFPTEFSVHLAGAEYQYEEETSDYVLTDIENNYDSASFLLGGRVNKNANWSAYTEQGNQRVVVHAIFHVDKMEE